MENLISQAEAINNLTATVLLAIILILLGYFYRRDFIRERKNNVEDKPWARDRQATLIGIIEKDIDSRDRASDANNKLSISIESLNQWLRAKLG